MAATTKRHPSRVRHRTGVTSDGRLLAQDIDVRLDAGAYVTLSPVVLSRAIIHSAGPYACEHVRIEGRAMFTNRVPFGAFRGFGNPQGCFGLERHMDVIAERLGMDPVELRRLNLIREGQATATGQVIGDGVDREAVLDRAIDLSGLRDRRRAHVAFNARDATRRRGIGVATFFHGAGFTGAGEVYLDSVVHVAGTAEGRFEVRSASTEMGQGTNTIFTQLAADRLGVDAGLIDIVQPDTHRVPDSGPTVASRTAMVVGRLVELACDDLKLQAGLSTDTEGDAVIDAVHAWYADRGRPTEREPAAVRDPPMSPRSELIGTGRYQKPPGIEWEEETYRGDAYGAFGWAAYVADVEVDLRTFAVRLLDFVAVQEIGKVLNEVLARGQIQGGVVQAIGWALYEELVEDERGSMRNTQLTNYIIPTSGDLPPIRVDFLEVPYPHGAQGAKGIGELPMNGPAPAIANAVAAALGVQPTAIPLTPERLMRLVDEAGPRQRRSA